MIRRSAELLAAAQIAFTAATALAGEPSTNQEVERSIEEITKPPPYDWLRGPRLDARAGPGERADRPVREEGREPRPRRQRPEQGDSCGYEPEQQGDGKPGSSDVPDRPRPEGEGCSSGPAPGGEVETVPQGGSAGGDGAGCGCDRALGDCGCDRTLGDCGCDRAVGSAPSCGGLAGAGAGLGYVLGAVALGLIVFLVVRAILRRDKSRGDDSIETDVDAASPEDLRVSEVAAMPAVTMMDRAAQAAMMGDYRTAVGWAYLAGISSLHRAGFTDLRVSTSNLAIVSSTRHRGGPHEQTSRLIRVFEELFFGGREAKMGHWEECRKIVQEELIHEPAG